MTYNVFGGMLNLALFISPLTLLNYNKNHPYVFTIDSILRTGSMHISVHCHLIKYHLSLSMS